jgi:hypothetical protein
MKLILFKNKCVLKYIKVDNYVGKKWAVWWAN